MPALYFYNFKKSKTFSLQQPKIEACGTLQHMDSKAWLFMAQLQQPANRTKRGRHNASLSLCL